MNECSSIFPGCTQCELPFICSLYDECPVDSGFHLEEKRCVRDYDCVDGGLICSACMLDGFRCVRCADEAFIENVLPDGSVMCSPCDEACDDCSGPGPMHCIRCAPGYDANKWGRCVAFDANCMQIDGNDGECTECGDGHYIYGGKCLVCDPSCLLCNEAESCTRCAPGYQIANGARDYPYKCFEANTKCQYFNYSGACIVCAEGFAMEDEGICLGQQGYNCVQTSDCRTGTICAAGVCSSCQPPTLFDEGECVQCSFGRGIKYDIHGKGYCGRCEVEHCAECFANVMLCDVCDDGYQLVNKRCTYYLQRNVITGIGASIFVAAAIGAVVIAWHILRRYKLQKLGSCFDHGYFNSDLVKNENGSLQIDLLPLNWRESNADIEPRPE